MPFPQLPAPPIAGVTLDEQTAGRVHRVAAWVAVVGAVGFFIGLTLAVCRVFDGRVVAMLNTIGPMAFSAAVWFSGAFRCAVLRHRPNRVTAGALLRSPSDWLPLPFLNVASIGGSSDGVHILNALTPVDRIEHADHLRVTK